MYIDEFLSRLSAGKLGCYIGNIVCGALGHADDITLLAPTVSSLKYVLNICHQFAEVYDVMLNLSKCKLLFFGRLDTRSCVHVPHVEFIGSVIELVKHDKHLGNVIGQNCSMHQIQDCLSTFNGKVNTVKSNFGHIDFDSLYQIIKTYCMSPYVFPTFGIMIITLSTHLMLHGERIFAGYSTPQPQSIIIYYYIFVMIYHQTYNYISGLSLLLMAYQNLPM